MNIVSRTITGTIIIILGIFVTTIALFGAYFILIYGILLIIIGIFILFNKKEDYIEQIKTTKTKSKGGKK